MVYPYLIFALLFQTSSAPVALLGNCAEPEHVLGTLEAGQLVRVRSAMAGAPVTCYAVTTTLDGKSIEGYILGDKLPAIVDFERQRREAALAAAQARAAAAVPSAAAPAPQERPHRPAFGDFSAVDMKGKAVTLKDVKGKVLVICFWSPASPASIRELLVVSHSFFKLHKQGLDVIAVSLDAGHEHIEDALEGSMAFPDIPDHYGIAARHGISNVPRTFILDERHEIVTAGLHGAALEDAIRETLKGE
jgi:peroxiredoxin